MAEDKQGIVLGQDEGRGYNLYGALALFKATGEETNGAYTQMEVHYPPNYQSYRHVHIREHESFYVLEGELEVGLGDDVVRLGPGSFAESPPGQPHWLRNAGPGKVRYICTLVPAGFEGFIMELGRPVPGTYEVVGPEPPDDIERVIATARRYGADVPD